MPPAGDAEQLFVKRVEELMQRAQYTHKLCSTMFCNEREQALAVFAANKVGLGHYCFAGGYAGAERQLFCAAHRPVSPEEVPIDAVRIAGKSAGVLTHRDYLGALMGLGIKRECMGDILCDEAGALLFLLPTVAAIVKDELQEVGRVSVRCTLADASELPQQKAPVPKTITLPSLRLDALLAAMLRGSRKEAAELIRKGAVQINHRAVNSLHEAVYAEDIFTVRGTGRYKLCEIGNKSKKDRIFVSYIQY